MKIAVNRDWGGFGLSEVAYNELGIPWDEYGYIENSDLGIQSRNQYAYRTDPRLIAVVEKLGKAASGSLACVEIVEIPDGIDWTIDEYDGMETVEEKHRSW